MNRRPIYCCPTCYNFGKVSTATVVNGVIVWSEPKTCPTCDGKGR